MRSRCLSRWVARAVISALGSLLPAAVSSYPSDDDRMLSVGRRPRWPFSISGSIAAGSQRPAPPRDRGTPVSRLQPSPRLVRFTARVRATRRLVRQGDVLPSRVAPGTWTSARGAGRRTCPSGARRRGRPASGEGGGVFRVWAVGRAGGKRSGGASREGQVQRVGRQGCRRGYIREAGPACTCPAGSTGTGR